MNKKLVIYAKRNLVLMIKVTIKSKIVNKEVLVIISARYKTPKEIPVVFHNDSTYDYHFQIKELAEEFEGQFECLGENTEKYLTFSVQIKKGNGNGKKPTCKIKFIGNFRFMSSSLSNLADNLPNGLHNKCTDCKSYLEYVSTDEVE